MRFRLGNNRWLLVAGCWLLVVGLALVGCGSPQPDEVGETAVPPTAAAIPTTVPEESAGPINLVWTVETGGPINQPPLRVGDLVIVVPERGAVMALDVKTGALQWQYAPPERVWDRAYASDGRFLFVGLENGKLVALDVQNGAVQWEKELGIDVQVPPLVADGILYAPTTFVGPGLSNDPEGRAKLFALATGDGSALWVFESGNYILQSPFLYDDALYAAGVFHDPEPVDEGGHLRLYALSANDGAVRWTYESEDGFPKQLYATETAVTFIAYQDFASGIDPATGELLWRRDTGNWVPTLSGWGDTLYFGSANTVVHALDMNDGAVKWQFNIPEGTFNYVLGAPVRVDDTLYFLTQQGDIMALNAPDGVLRWRETTGIVAARTGLSVSDGWLFIGDAEGRIHAYAINSFP